MSFSISFQEMGWQSGHELRSHGGHSLLQQLSLGRNSTTHLEL